MIENAPPLSRRLLKILLVLPVAGRRFSLVGMQGKRAVELAGPDVWEVCRELIPAGSVFAFLAEHREALFPAGMFADVPSPNGRPSVPPQVLAAVVVLQALHGLSDFETVQVLRCDLRWKAGWGCSIPPSTRRC